MAQEQRTQCSPRIVTVVAPHLYTCRHSLFLWPDRVTVSQEDLKPYEFARRRFFHACYVLLDTDRSVRERLLDAVVALSPLRAEDLPRSCQVLYERVQQLIGPQLWSDVATSGALAPAVRTLTEQQALDAVRWLFLAGDLLDQHFRTSTTRRPAGQAKPAGEKRRGEWPPEYPSRDFYFT